MNTQQRQPKFQEGQQVKCTLLDGQVKDRPGKVLGCAPNSKFEPVYLVEMFNPPNPGDANYGRTEGKAQIEAGKPWVLSLYEEELTTA